MTSMLHTVKIYWNWIKLMAILIVFFLCNYSHLFMIFISLVYDFHFMVLDSSIFETYI